jgi:hypothetical protein
MYESINEIASVCDSLALYLSTGEPPPFHSFIHSFKWIILLKNYYGVTLGCWRAIIFIYNA